MDTPTNALSLDLDALVSTMQLKFSLPSRVSVIVCGQRYDGAPGDPLYIDLQDNQSKEYIPLEKPIAPECIPSYWQLTLSFHNYVASTFADNDAFMAEILDVMDQYLKKIPVEVRLPGPDVIKTLFNTYPVGSREEFDRQALYLTVAIPPLQYVSESEEPVEFGELFTPEELDDIWAAATASAAT